MDIVIRILGIISLLYFGIGIIEQYVDTKETTVKEVNCKDRDKYGGDCRIVERIHELQIPKKIKGEK